MKSKKWILTKHFEGPVNEEYFKLIEEDLPEITDGGTFPAHSTFIFFSLILNRGPVASYLFVSWSLYAYIPTAQGTYYDRRTSSRVS